jgi:hypothetical protein
MPIQTFLFSVEEVKKIYQAGIRRGGDEQSAHDWGCRPSGKEYDECIDALHDILNDGVKWDDPNYTDISEVEKWFKEE